MTKEELQQRNRAILAQYFPEGTSDIAYEWIQKFRFRFRISRSRQTRFGDYQASTKLGEPHKISVNHDLNPYAFLITFLHEIAHLITYERHRDNVLPHGTEWKQAFSELLTVFLTRRTFPPDIENALQRTILNPKASSCTDQQLFRVLKRYDHKPVVHLEELPTDSIFSLGKNGIYKKGIKRRTRYLCQHLTNKKNYLISGIAEVKPISSSFPF
ncbi:MAG: SprT-like domain-containing protein [Flavobacteriales bacterium]|nr:SprT-like domain-containing protein [Flavobacteriales bacterium]